MAVRSTELERAFAEIRRISHAGLDEAALLREVAERLRQAVPMDSYCMHTNDPASGLVTGGVLSDPGYAVVARAALEQVQFEDDVTPFSWMVGHRVAAVSLAQSTGGRPERALRYREVMRPIGAEQELRAVFAADGELWGSMTAMRDGRASDFDPREIALLGRVAPQVAAGLRAAALRGEGHEVRVAHDGPSALTIAANLQPEVAFLDLDLPVMDGYEIAQRLVALSGSRPPRLVAVTGLAHASEVARTHAAGFERHLVKPVDLAVARAFARGEAVRGKLRGRDA